MPAYNSAAWIGAAIESILAQTFRDFELIISDNASTDATVEVCNRYARADSRIRVLREPVNFGANRNYLKVFRAARGGYFKWASSNDICAPTFVERCVARLDADSSVVLASPRSVLFEREPADGQPYGHDLELLDSDASVRFIQLFSTLELNNVLNGVIRRDALLQAASLGRYTGADVVLMGELALLGKFVLVDERLFFRRMSRDAATRLMSKREAESRIVPTARAPLKWQEWCFRFGVLRASRLAAFPSRTWLRTVGYGLRTFVWSRGALAREILEALCRGRSYT